MKLYIKQKVFSLTSKFTVKDESGNDRYFVEGEFFSLRGRLHIMDAQAVDRKEEAMIGSNPFQYHNPELRHYNI